MSGKCRQSTYLPNFLADCEGFRCALDLTVTRFLLIFSLNCLATMMYSSTAITGLALALTPLSFAAPTATVDNGVLSGVSTSVPGGARPVSKFLGIPYAQKAVRFEPPKAAGQSGDEIDCTEYKDTCIQLFGGLACPAHAKLYF